MTQQHSILVVEDETSIASFVSAYLRNAGYEVRAAASAKAARSEHCSVRYRANLRALTRSAFSEAADIAMSCSVPDAPSSCGRSDRTRGASSRIT